MEGEVEGLRETDGLKSSQGQGSHAKGFWDYGKNSKLMPQDPVDSSGHRKKEKIKVEGSRSSDNGNRGPAELHRGMSGDVYGAGVIRSLEVLGVGGTKMRFAKRQLRIPRA